MKKIINTLIIAFLIVFTLSSCDDVDSNNTISPEIDITESNVLISYFTWADNTHVENPSDVDIDASTSASLLAPGNAAIVASFINDVVEADIFSIQVVDLYPSDYNQCLTRAYAEKADNARPELKTTVENMEQYDIIFLGYPNWVYTVPMALYSFLEAYDFSGKTIIPFCVHGTGGLASSIRDIKSVLEDDVTFIENPFDVYRPNTLGCKDEVTSWLSELGFEVE